MTSEPLAGKISLVVPVLDEAPNIAPLCDEVRSALAGRDWELVFVDDGSTDGTFEAIRAEHAIDEGIRGVRFRANAGKSAAYAAGFKAARGDIIATLDGDLQDDPTDLAKLLARLAEGPDLVVGWKTAGKSSPLTFVLSKVANLLLRLVSPLRLHDMNCPIRAMRKEVARSLDLRADLHRYIPLMAASRGFSVAEVPVANRPRQHGRSKYGGSKYLKSATALLGVGLYLRYSERPMALFGTLGLVSLLAGLAVCGTVVVHFVAFDANIDDDIPTLILGAMLVLVGMQFIAIGLLAEIVVRRIRVAADLGPSEVIEEL